MSEGPKDGTEKTLAELRASMEACYDDLELASRRREQLEREVLKLMAERGGFTVSKKDLASVGTADVEIEPDDAIEFRAERNPRPEAETDTIWYVRNKRIAERPKVKPFNGNVEEANLDELQEFLTKMSRLPLSGEGVGGISALETVLYSKRQNDNYFKDYLLYCIKNAEGRIIGAAFSHGENGRHAYIPTIAIDPKYQSTGAGTALLSEMKRRFTSLRLVPVPHSNTTRYAYEELEQRLRVFYQRNGFVDARNWDKAWISLADETTAGQWRALDLLSGHGLGLDTGTIGPTEAMHNVFAAILGNPMLQTQFPPEIVPKLKEELLAREETRRLNDLAKSAHKAYTAERNRLHAVENQDPTNGL